ncbi:3698_t:CDS:2 [Paraglomus occultum]|uniref:3698_t:CDS:1 n=1 Tax=Paraglomus occultum TaxID=144539 RepID=A0A9N9FPU7_9GLOM|nr:3698_t:CDS:2 [Paraglomus occultum]
MSENEELATILPSDYKLDYDKLEITLVDYRFFLPLPTATVLCPDTSVVLASWNRLSQNDKNEAYPPVAPNFIAEIRSNMVTAEAVHRKMCLYMDAGVEAFSIDPINGTARIYRVQRNNITWLEYTNPLSLKSRVLNGFVLNLQGIL